jgi:hypothetical protein
MAYDANYLDGTDKNNPTGQEPKSLGDDAIREIKRVLQNMFPTVFLTPNDSYSGTLAQLSELAASQTFPRDTVVMWAPTATLETSLPDGPDGWTICDGRARKDGGGGIAPDMTNRFILGAKSRSDVSAEHGDANDTGVFKGNNELQVRTSGVPTNSLVSFRTGDTQLDAGDIPNHVHAMFGASLENPGPIPGQSIVARGRQNGGDADYQVVEDSSSILPSVGETGPNNPLSNTPSSHNHSFVLNTQNTFCNISEYYTALYIIKD